MGYQTAPHGNLGLPGGLYQFMALTEGTALPFEFEWVLYPAYGSQPSIESIRDITGTEKKQSQNQQLLNS